MAEVGCAKVASANVETVFSGAGRLSMKLHCLGPQLLSDYTFLHYNYKYDWLRPTLEEIVDVVTPVQWLSPVWLWLTICWVSTIIFCNLRTEGWGDSMRPNRATTSGKSCRS